MWKLVCWLFNRPSEVQILRVEPPGWDEWKNTKATVVALRDIITQQREIIQKQQEEVEAWRQAMDKVSLKLASLGLKL